MERSIIFILLSMLLSCTGNKVYDHQLSKADSIMDIADDFAQIAIKMLDALNLNGLNLLKLKECVMIYFIIRQ